jgi:hypothetical protein
MHADRSVPTLALSTIPAGFIMRFPLTSQTYMTGILLLNSHGYSHLTKKKKGKDIPVTGRGGP